MHTEQPIEIVINPRGSEIRSQCRVWNNGDGRMRLYTVSVGVHVVSSGFHDMATALMALRVVSAAGCHKHTAMRTSLMSCGAASQTDHDAGGPQVGSGAALTPPVELEPASDALLHSVDETFGNAFSKMPLF